ncbi:Hsp20/alpha crystallin family protein [Nitrosomonas sp. Nm33]|uniref:Hsp20/alpha crystallin family protein n=1 Tax=Nitrosomonas sp. Nm33 TaxID=133724 RepID=UPI00089AEC61|nr:Hsp20/alpha crystallin family protein [Nitrosomonas sp. Nm33]SDY42899.1 HSP20 family protein [Nitrosomonas sp. Nm33]
MTSTKRPSQPSEISAEKPPSTPLGETTATQPPPGETTIIKPSSVLPSNVTDLLVTLGDWLGNVGIHIGEIPQMKADLIENPSAYTLHADIPGVNKSDIKVQLESSCVVISVEKKKEAEQKEGERIISCERTCEPVSRTFRLDEEIDLNKAQAQYENGVLKLTLPKKYVKTIKELQIA